MNTKGKPDDTKELKEAIKFGKLAIPLASFWPIMEGVIPSPQCGSGRASSTFLLDSGEWEPSPYLAG